MIILPANTLSTSVYEIANSCRFNDDDTASMTRTTETPTDPDKYTFSVWVKIGNPGIDNSKIFSVKTGSYGEEKLEFNADDLLWRKTEASGGETDYERETDRKFRDPGAWYHILIAYDSSDGTAGDRMKMYVNGVRETSFGGSVNPDSSETSWLNTASLTLYLGNAASVTQYFDGYMAEVAFVDGVAHAVTDFGEFDSDSPTIWKPKDISSGITWGNNGFWLDFEDSSALGNDVSGNNNDFSVSNLAAIDQVVDSPTNNFCTVNPLDNYHQQATFSEGNTKITFKGATSVYAYSTGTFGVANGKWYWEVKATSAGNHDMYGISGRNSIAYNAALGKYTDEYGYYNYNGNYSNASSDGSYAENSFAGGNVTWTTNDIIGIALDLDSGTNTVKFYKNNALTGTVNIIAPSTGFYYPAFAQVDNQAEVCQPNFGNPSYTLSSAQNDANGYGNFEYAPPSGYLALCTKNLAEEG